MSRILFIYQSCPYNGARAKDGIDATLVASAFGQEVSVLFSGDAVYQLIAAQNAAQFGAKSIDKLIRSFDLYDVKKIFVEKSALRTRGVQESALSVEAIVLEQSDIQSLLHQHDIVMSF